MELREQWCPAARVTLPNAPVDRRRCPVRRPDFLVGCKRGALQCKGRRRANPGAFKANDFSEAVLKPYEVRLRKGVAIWYDFIKLYYKLLPAFTHFIQHKKYRRQLFQLLQGDVYDRDEALPVLDAMRRYVDAVESTDGHLLKGALDQEIVVS